MSGHRIVGVWARGLIVAILLASPFVAPSAAEAHALLVSSTPADGATYDRAPSDVTLTFSEGVDLTATSIEMFDGSGTPVTVGRPASVQDGSEVTVVRVPLDALPRDRYLLRWRSVASDDLHPTAGTIVFGIGTEVSPAGEDVPSGWSVLGAVAETIMRWVALMALGVGLAARVVSRRPAVRARSDLALLPRISEVGAGAGALATLALGLFYLARIADVAGLLTTLGAWQMTLRWTFAIAAAAASWLMLRRPHSLTSERLPWAPAALLVIALVAITSIGHATSSGTVTAALGALHTVVTLLWVCGVAVVAAVVVTARHRGDRERAVVVARAFTAIALVAVPVSLVTGLLLAGRLIPSVGALLNTDYGHALLLKLGLLIAGLLCAAATFTLLVLGAGRRRAAVAVIAEALVLCAVVLAASAVASLPPASAVVWAPDSASPPTSGVLSQIARDLVVTVDMGPGRPGRNFITVGVLDTRRPAPAPIAAVQVAVGGQGPLTAVRQDPFKWMVVTNVATEGPEQLQVAVRRPGEPTVVVPFVWVAGPPLGTRLGGASLSPVSSVAAAVVGLCALIGLALGPVLRIRRRSGPVREDDVWPGRRQHASKGSGSTSPTVDREPWVAEEARDSPTGV